MLLQFRSELNALARDGGATATIWVYVEETLMPKSDQLLVFTFRVNTRDRVRAVLQHVVRKLDIAMPAARCCLETQAGFRLRSGETLATYGVGTLLPAWRLELRERRKTRRASPKMPPALPLPDSSTHVVEVRFPPLVQLKGMRAKVLKLDVTCPVSQIIEGLCERWAVPDPAQFCFTTVKPQVS